MAKAHKRILYLPMLLLLTLLAAGCQTPGRDAGLGANENVDGSLGDGTGADGVLGESEDGLGAGASGALGAGSGTDGVLGDSANGVGADGAGASGVLGDGSGADGVLGDGTGVDGVLGDETGDNQLYILLYSDTEAKRMFVQGTETGKQIEFEYSGGTYIHGRYGESLTAGQLQEGELLRLDYTDKNLLTEITVPAETFDFQQMEDVQIDEDASIFTVMGDKYKYDGSLKIFSEGSIISLNELSDMDVLRLRGIGRQLLTVVVERGHGKVSLRDTDLFEGGMVAIGGEVVREVRADMTLEVPEGTYVLSVANNGYGASTEITVSRFSELLVSLAELPVSSKNCKITFAVNPSDAVVKINGATVDCSSPMILRFGTYQVTAEADGYETFSRTLVVGSQEAYIPIEMEAESEDEEETDADTSTDSDTGTNTDANTNTNTNSDTDTNASTNNDANTNGTTGTESSTGASEAGTGTSDTDTSGTAGTSTSADEANTSATGTSGTSGADTSAMGTTGTSGADTSATSATSTSGGDTSATGTESSTGASGEGAGTSGTDTN